VRSFAAAATPAIPTLESGYPKNVADLRSKHKVFGRTAERSGQQGTISEPHDEIRATVANAEIGGELLAHGGHLDRLIDESMS
jgi:hypothetical protein